MYKSARFSHFLTGFFNDVSVSAGTFLVISHLIGQHLYYRQALELELGGHKTACFVGHKTELARWDTKLSLLGGTQNSACSVGHKIQLA